MAKVASECAFVQTNHPSAWHAPTQAADYVVISHGDFIAQVSPLAALRVQQGHRAAVIDVQDLYDEFSFGEKTPQALQDFLRWARTNGNRGGYGAGYGNGNGNGNGYANDDYSRYRTNYDARSYYRDDPRYQERVLSSNDEVYRGSEYQVRLQRRLKYFSYLMRKSEINRHV